MRMVLFECLTLISTTCNYANNLKVDDEVVQPSCYIVEVSNVIGHTDRVFDVRWSLLTPNLLCSSSDDMTIRVWNCNSEVEC